jgi:hypothetical protein
MERRVEAGDLRQVGVDRGDRADAGEIVRLMERRQRAERLQPGEHGRIDAHRCRIVDAAMHHAVADAEQPGLAEKLPQPAPEHPERPIMVERPVRRPAFVDKAAAVHTGRHEVR